MQASRLSRAIIAAILVSFAASPVDAQIGGLIKKKAAEKAAQKVVQQNQATDPKDVPLTEDAFRALLKGLEAERPRAEKARASWRRADSLEKGAQQLQESHQTEYVEYEKRSDAVNECQSAEGSRLSQVRQEEVEKKQNDPMLIARIQTAAMQHAQASQALMAKNDTVGLEKENAAYMKRIAQIAGQDLGADSIAIAKKCGSVPPPPAWLTQKERMERDAQSARADFRMADSEIIGAGAQASGMNIERYAQARERLTMWVNASGLGKAGKTCADVRDSGKTSEEKMFVTRCPDIIPYRASLVGYDQP